MKLQNLVGNPANRAWYYVPTPRLTSDSSPYQLGFEHGKAFRHVIQTLLRDKVRKLNFDRNLEELTAPIEARRNWLKNTFPDEYQENEGIAAGAEVSPLLTLFYNYYLGQGFPKNIPNVNIPHCTGFCMPGKYTDSGTICGNNCDDDAVYFLLEYTGTHWPKYIMATWFGMVGGFGGMNEFGLYIGDTGASILRQDDRLGPEHYTPSMMVFNLVLRYCKNVDEAVKLIARDDVMGHSNHILADVSGKACVVEKALAVSLTSYEITEKFAIGNFFHSEAKRDPDALKRLFKNQPGTESRYLSMLHHIEQSPRPFTAQRGKEIMASTYKARPEVKNYASVCNWHTQITYVALPQKKTIHISGKSPTDSNWLEYKF
ncbi:MAG: C45 family peptidase [Planctomycetota bacterium]